MRDSAIGPLGAFVANTLLLLLLLLLRKLSIAAQTCSVLAFSRACSIIYILAGWGGKGQNDVHEQVCRQLHVPGCPSSLLTLYALPELDASYPLTRAAYAYLGSWQTNRNCYDRGGVIYRVRAEQAARSSLSPSFCLTPRCATSARVHSLTVLRICSEGSQARDPPSYALQSSQQ